MSDPSGPEIQSPVWPVESCNGNHVHNDARELGSCGSWLFSMYTTYAVQVKRNKYLQLETFSPVRRGLGRIGKMTGLQEGDDVALQKGAIAI